MKQFLRFSVQMFLAVLLIVLGVELLALAQGVPAASPSPGAVIMAAAQSSGGIMSWLAAHGGLMAVVSGCAMFMNAILCGVRNLLLFLDGVKPGDVIPPNFAGLTKLNIACIYLGKILDYLMANPQH